MGYFEQDEDRIKEEVKDTKAYYERERARYEAEGIDDYIISMAGKCLQYFRLIRAGFPADKLDLSLSEWYCISAIAEYKEAKREEQFYKFFSAKV